MPVSRALERATTELNRRLNEWRKHYQAPTPLPDEIWEEAVEVAAVHGVYQTSRALGLNYANLKKRVEDVRDMVKSPPALPPRPTFIELRTPMPAVVGECALEVASRQGARMRVEMRDIPVSGLVTILREFAG